jgi:hypothetical protein
MTSKVKAGRVRDNQDNSPFSGIACLLLLLFAGILAKIAAFTPIIHFAHWH